MKCLSDPANLFQVLWLLFGQESGQEGGAGNANNPLDLLFGGRYGFMIALLLMFMVLYFLLIRPESRRHKARDAMLKSLKKGDHVVTTSGIIGKIHRVDEKEVLVQVDKDSNVKMRFLRSAINDVLPGAAKGADKESGN